MLDTPPSYGGGLRLKAVQVVGGFLGVGGGLEDGPLVGFEHGQPVVEIAGVVGSRLAA